MRLLASFCVALLLVPVLAGCLAPDEEDEATLPFFDEAMVSPTVDWWEDYATRWLKRDWFMPWKDEVSEYLRAELEGAGFDARILSYAPREQGVDLPQVEPFAEVHVVEAVLPGRSHPDRAIGLVTHYDAHLLTLQGAYDNASGTAAQMTLCKELAKLELEHTLVCLFFDAEERGLVASQRYVDDVVLGGTGPFVFDFVVGYDMTGINWPGHEWKMYVMTGGADHVPALGHFARDLLHGQMGYPEDGVEVLDTHDRNSDERNFREAGVPIFRFAGGRHAAEYPEYHRPGDTVEYVYAFVDGRANFEAGMQTILEASYQLILALDRTGRQTVLSEYAA